MIRGFFIFLVFIFKPSVWIMIKKRHPKVTKAILSIIGCSNRPATNAILRGTENGDQTNDATKQVEDGLLGQRLIAPDVAVERIEVASTAV